MWSVHCEVFHLLILFRNILTSSYFTQRDERVLVLWSNDLEGIIPLCRDFEARLIKLVWRARGTTSAAASELSSSNTPSDDDLAEKSKEAADVAVVDKEHADRGPHTKSIWKLFSWRSTRSEHALDLESAASKKRQAKLIAPFYTGLGCALAIREYVLGLECSV